MAQKKIIWTETAAQQRKSILEYWVQRNQSTTYSLKLLRLSNEKANLIADNPLTYRDAEFPDTHVAAMVHFSLHCVMLSSFGIRAYQNLNRKFFSDGFQ